MASQTLTPLESSRVCVCPPGLAALLPMANFLVISHSNNSLLGCFPAIISAAEGEWQQEKCWTTLAQL